MRLVTGIGGLFFRAKDPAGLKQWYADQFDITVTPNNYDDPPWRTDAGTTVFEPFPADTDYFGDRDKAWMLNLRTCDLDALVERLRRSGVAVEVDPRAFPNGRFARLVDPEGNPIELWEPSGEDPG